MNDWRLDNLNFARDRRNCEPAKVPVLVDDDGNEIALPVKWGVCPVCNGAGKHVNPAIDCGGLNNDDFDDDPDFAANYRNGMYDIPCNYCGGRTTVQVVDERRLTQDLAKLLNEYEQDAAEARAEYLAEIRMGC